MDREIPLDIPVRILQGGLDEDVPWSYSLQLVEKLRSTDVVWTLIKDGDHRLSRPQDVRRIVSTALATADQADAASEAASPSR
jgi:dipeptidyl aminopeptidase/acylaminoacyl peptidase